MSAASAASGAHSGRTTGSSTGAPAVPAAPAISLGGVEPPVPAAAPTFSAPALPAAVWGAPAAELSPPQPPPSAHFCSDGVPPCAAFAVLHCPAHAATPPGEVSFKKLQSREQASAIEQQPPHHKTPRRATMPRALSTRRTNSGASRTFRQK